MKKIRAAVVGYGNIGHYALQALEAAPDFEVAGIVRRNGAENKPEELARYDVVKDIRELQDGDVAILATPSSCAAGPLLLTRRPAAAQICPIIGTFLAHTLLCVLRLLFGLSAHTR